MPVINNGSQHDRIRKLQARTIYAAYLTDKAAVDDKVLVQSSLNPQTSSDFTSMKEGAFFFTPEELDAVLQNNATTSPVTVPDAPTIVSAVGGNGQATVSWTVPANNGGSQIIDYTVLSTPGSLTLTVTGASSSTAVITGLTNGTAYTFTITARNSVGNSTPSSASSPVTPNTSVPDAPLISGTTTPTTTSITFAFTPPTNDGGSAILDYSILGVTLNSSAVGFTIGTTNYTSSQSVTGLSPGQIIISGLDYSTSSTTNTYIISLIARNIMGNSSPLTITQATATATTPATGSAGTGSAGLGGGTTVATTSTLTTITFSFVASSDTGGIPITDYTLGLALGSSAVPFTIGSTNYSAGQTVTIASPGTITISGLDYSTLITTKTYNISITTNNAIGSSSPLIITKATATALVADAPTLSGTTTSTLQTITFSFAQTVATGNQLSVSNYTLEVSLNSSAVPFTIGSTNYSAGQSATINSPGTITISGLEYSTSGTTKSYNLSLVANNPVGASSPLTITKATGTAYLPNAPGLSGTTTFTGTSITFTFADGPALGGALPVLDHILSYSSSSPTISSPTFIVNSTTYTSSQSVTGISEGTVVISGLQNSTTYTFNLYTRNSLGNSSPLAITQATNPAPPTISGTPTSTGKTITFSFDAPSLTFASTYYILSYSTSTYSPSLPASLIPSTFVVNSTSYTYSESVTISSPGTVIISGLDYSIEYTFNLYTRNSITGPSSLPLTITQATRVSSYVASTFVNSGLSTPRGMAIDADGNIIIADTNNNKIKKITPSGTVTTIAGTGTYGYSDVPGSVSFRYPMDVAVGPDGSIYVADYANERIRKISTNGDVSTLGGSDSSLLNNPLGSIVSNVVEVDSAGNVFCINYGIMKKIAPDGTISTFATGFNGGGGGLAFGPDGNLYAADANNNCIKMITPGGVVSTLTGIAAGYIGGGNSRDGGGSTNPTFSNPQAISFGSDGTMYIADMGSFQIRKANYISSIGEWFFQMVAGSTTSGYADGSDNIAQFFSPKGLAVLSDGTIVVSDGDRIRKLTQTETTYITVIIAPNAPSLVDPQPTSTSGSITFNFSQTTSSSAQESPSTYTYTLYIENSNQMSRKPFTINSTPYSRFQDATLYSTGELTISGLDSNTPYSIFIKANNSLYSSSYLQIDKSTV